MSDGTRISTVPGEARPYQGLRAGFVTRLGASAVDFLVVIVALVVAYAGWSAVRLLLDGPEFRFPTPTFATAYAVGTLMLALYFAAAWATTGRTYGAHLLGLRVIDRHGARLGTLLALVRAVLCVLVPIGLLWCLLSRENRSVQDLIVRSSVIYDWSIRGKPRTR